MERLAVVFVFVSNGLMIVGMLYMLYRLSDSVDETHNMMVDASADLVAAGRSLRGLGAGVDRMVERLSMADRQTAAASRAATESVTSAGPLIDSAMRSQGERLAQDLARRLAASEERLLASVAQMLGARDGANERSSDADTRLEALRQDLQACREDNAMRAEADAALRESLQQELESARLASQKQQQALTALQDVMHRTLIEKDFIEQKFLDLDTAAEAGAAAA